MKKLIYILVFLAFIPACDKSAPKQNTTPPPQGKLTCEEQAIEGEYVLLMEDGSIKLVKGMNQKQFIQTFVNEKPENVLISEPNYRINLSDAPSIPKTGCTNEFWHIDDTKPKAFWDAGFTGAGVKIAILDSGVDYNHPAIRSSIAINQGETGLDQDGNDKSSNGKDDDGNGYVDDYRGYNFLDKNNNAQDISGHGTWVTGTITAEHSTFFDPLNKSETQVYGVAPGAKILPIKFLDETTSDTKSIIDALKYAVEQKADIINMSFGGEIGCSTILPTYLKSIEENEILLVAASGNGGLDLDRLPEPDKVYPAALNLKNQITVGAIGTSFQMANFSNYGLDSVELFAPGRDIISTSPNSSTTCIDGTSFSAPIVSGSLALIKEKYPQLSVLEIKKLMLDNVTKDSFYLNLTEGRLNLKKVFDFDPTPENIKALQD